MCKVLPINSKVGRMENGQAGLLCNSETIYSPNSIGTLRNELACRILQSHLIDVNISDDQNRVGLLSFTYRIAIISAAIGLKELLGVEPATK